MSDAGADGYTGLTLLYHQSTTQLIIQWTGVDINQSERIEAEQNLLKLLKGAVLRELINYILNLFINIAWNS